METMVRPARLEQPEMMALQVQQDQTAMTALLVQQVRKELPVQMAMTEQQVQTETTE
jgi:hypothetical protein